MPDLIGQSLGRYHILEQLGEGGMAVVYKAFDTRLERDVAIKIIRRGAFPPEQLEQILKRFEREAKALARLSHPNIVKVHDYGEYGGAPYLVMEYLPGGTLKQKMGKPMFWPEAVGLLIPVAHALDYAHQQGILHRDVKPANILITASGEPMLTDFGIAKILDIEETHTLTGTGVGIGTPEYMAPEQGLGKKIDPRADIYSLGIVFYELVTGRKPYTADTPMAVIIKHVNEPLPPPRQFVPTIPEQVERVLFKALAKAPEDRFPDMAAFANTLESLSSTTAPADDSTWDPFGMKKSTSPQPAPGLAIPRWLAITGSAGMIIIIAIVAGSLYYSSKRSHESIPPVPSLSLTQSISGVPSAIFTTKPAFTSLTLPSETPTRPSSVDGMELVDIPAGEFLIGVTKSDQDLLFTACPDCDPTSFHDAPQQRIDLSEFWIDQTEVNVAQFARFVQASGYRTTAERQGYSYAFDPSVNSFNKTNGRDWLHPQGVAINMDEYGKHPVVHVSWDDANAYCAWAGERLPTEAEWEKAARGLDGRLFPWGNELPSTRLANFDLSNGDSLPVGSFPAGASPYRVLDMAGNVWEWTSAYYQEYYYISMPRSDPPGPSSGMTGFETDRVVKGSSWGTFLRTELVLISSAYRLSYPQAYSSELIGFRCVRDGNP